ncbi:type IV pilin protein [Endozoicomonas sp.]|uniref:type IV pilin protein n=1 Tax=Endozoicomonas sp. TaxID=1892382 RepID=UPI002883EA4E|nr:type IV pilin protein [Endozoicomonas sp.]
MKNRMSVVYRRERGFTLSELIIVVAIIGILAGIVYPSYSQYMYETRRSDAWVTLSAAAAAQERWYSINYSYTDAISNLGGNSSPEGYYTISVEADSTSFTLTATALSTAVQASDSGCTAITLDHFGVQSPSQCWK